MNQSPLVVVCVPVYGAFPEALNAIRSIARADGCPSLVVLDDASPGDEHASFRVDVENSVPPERLLYRRFAYNQGLTRMWNEGWRAAREAGAAYFVAGNSDVLVGAHALTTMIAVCARRGSTLVGPMTNAPGHVRDQQACGVVQPRQPVVDAMDEVLRKAHGSDSKVVPRVNGFFALGQVDRLPPYDSENLFNPRNRMTGNEDELQARMAHRGLVSRVALGAYVFHYRSLSRGLAGRSADRGAYRE